jgi:hypothetical protein
MLHLRLLQIDGLYTGRGFTPIPICVPRRPIHQTENLPCCFPPAYRKSFRSFFRLYRSSLSDERSWRSHDSQRQSHSFRRRIYIAVIRKNWLSRWTWFHFLISLLSNGQTRRARIVKAILDNPVLLLLLDEPLSNCYLTYLRNRNNLSTFLAAGLDPQSRKILNEALAQLHFTRSPRIILGLTQGEQVLDWVTHILDVRDGTTSVRHLFDDDSNNFSHLRTKAIEGKLPTPTPVFPPKHKVGDVVVDMKDVNVTYGLER